MIRLPHTVNAWGRPEFADVMKREIAQLSPDQLPLQEGLSTGNYALGNEFHLMIIQITDDDEFIRAKAGLFYNSIIAGCSCADDPTPVNENPEYCEVQIVIHKATAEATITLLPQ